MQLPPLIKSSSRWVNRLKSSRFRDPILSCVLEAERLAALTRTRRLRDSSSYESYAVAAFYSKPNGLTRGAQLQIDAMRDAGYPVSVADTTRRRHERKPRDLGPETLVLHSGAPETPRLLNGLDLPSKIYTVGYWAWELPHPPRDWKKYESLVSEIWTPSTFSAGALKKLFDIPVHVVPHRIPVQPPRTRDPSRPFTFLALADSRSSFERKNPEGAISAFRAAFGDRKDVQLVVKLSGRDQQVQRLMLANSSFENVSFLVSRLSLEEMAALYRRADVLISLHRAEGFGLPLLEAMSHGVPVVATAWSGNLDFMGKQDSVLVPYELVPVRDPAGVYNYDSVWAEPKTEAAIEVLKRLEAEADFYSRMSSAAYRRACAQEPFRAPRGSNS